MNEWICSITIVGLQHIYIKWHENLKNGFFYTYIHLNISLVLTICTSGLNLDHIIFGPNALMELYESLR